MTASRLLIVVWIVLMLAVLLPPFVASADAVLFHVRLTVDIALLFYALAVGAMLWVPRIANPIRWAWTLAFVAYCIHVAFAFHHVHQWSHAAAVQHTEEVSGFGNGIYVSHFFTLIWGLDVLWWWLSPLTYQRRPAVIGGAVHVFMAFMILNGTVVFESGPARWFGVLIFTVFGILLIRRAMRRRPSLP